MFAVAGGGDAAEVVGVACQDGFDGFPDGGAVFMEGEFIQDEIAGEAAGGAGICGEDFDAAIEAMGADVEFEAHGFEMEGVGFVHGFIPGAIELADLNAFGEKLGAVFAGIGEDGDEAAGSGDKAVHGPGGEGEGFADLPGPVQDEDAGLAVAEDGFLIRAEMDGGTEFDAGGFGGSVECGMRSAELGGVGLEGEAAVVGIVGVVAGVDLFLFIFWGRHSEWGWKYDCVLRVAWGGFPADSGTTADVSDFKFEISNFKWQSPSAGLVAVFI